MLSSANTPHMSNIGQRREKKPPNTPTVWIPTWERSARSLRFSKAHSARSSSVTFDKVSATAVWSRAWKKKDFPAIYCLRGGRKASADFREAQKGESGAAAQVWKMLTKPESDIPHFRWFGWREKSLHLLLFRKNPTGNEMIVNRAEHCGSLHTQTAHNGFCLSRIFNCFLFYCHFTSPWPRFIKYDPCVLFLGCFFSLLMVFNVRPEDCV